MNSINNVLKKFNHAQMAEIISELDLPDELIKSQILEEKSDMQVISILLDAEQTEAAIKFLALGLPKREAIWWSYVSIKEEEESKECVATQESLQLLQDWVRAPDEEKRLQAGKLGEQLDLATPASWATTALFWSGGSITPENVPAAEPEDFMCGEAVANAIIFSSEQSSDPKNSMELFLKRGLHIAMNGNGLIS